MTNDCCLNPKSKSTKCNHTEDFIDKNLILIFFFLSFFSWNKKGTRVRVWSWLRMNACDGPNTCKSNVCLFYFLSCFFTFFFLQSKKTRQEIKQTQVANGWVKRENLPVSPTQGFFCFLFFFFLRNEKQKAEWRIVFQLSLLVYFFLTHKTLMPTALLVQAIGIVSFSSSFCSTPLKEE